MTQNTQELDIFFKPESMVIVGASEVLGTFGTRYLTALMDIPVNIRDKYNKPVVIILPEDLTGVENIDMEKERRRLRDFFFKNNIPVYKSE